VGKVRRRGWGRAARRGRRVGEGRPPVRMGSGGEPKRTGWGRAGEDRVGARQGNYRAPPAAGNVGDGGKGRERKIRSGGVG
jgi:hypothetical protein